jgi:hypothetical protein
MPSATGPSSPTDGVPTPPAPFPEPSPADPPPTSADPLPTDRPGDGPSDGSARRPSATVTHDDLERAQDDRFPTTLAAVIAVDHLRIANLLDEISRPSDTPGVFDDVAAQLARDIDRHLACVERVVHPEVAASLGDLEADVAMASRRLLIRMSDMVRAADPSRRPNVDHLRLAFDRHVEAEKLLLDRFEVVLGGKHAAKLGADFSAVNDSMPRHDVRKVPPRPIVPSR